jgi:hypothetical protein
MWLNELARSCLGMKMTRVKVETGRGTGTAGYAITIDIGECLIEGGIDISRGVGSRIGATVVTSGETMTSVSCLATSNQIVNPLIGHNIMRTAWNV